MASVPVPRGQETLAEQLTLTEDRYRTLFETLPQGVIYCAADGLIIEANPAASEILGVGADAMISWPLAPAWHAVHEDGSPWRPDRFSESFRYYARKSDVPRVRFHDLRHSHATHLLRAGVHLKVASARLGHSTTKLTADTYSHVLSGMDRDASAMVGRRLREAAENLLANR